MFIRQQLLEIERCAGANRLPMTRKPLFGGLPSKTEQVAQEGLGVVALGRGGDLFQLRAGLNEVEQDAAEALAIQQSRILELQKRSKRADFQPECRVEAEFRHAVLDFARGARPNHANHRVDPHNDEVALRQPSEEGGPSPDFQKSHRPSMARRRSRSPETSAAGTPTPGLRRPNLASAD